MHECQVYISSSYFPLIFRLVITTYPLHISTQMSNKHPKFIRSELFCFFSPQICSFLALFFSVNSTTIHPDCIRDVGVTSILPSSTPNYKERQMCFSFSVFLRFIHYLDFTTWLNLSISLALQRVSLLREYWQSSQSYRVKLQPLGGSRVLLWHSSVVQDSQAETTHGEKW